jgi:glycosyltransferase involved in cell wall biosynthesis
MSAMSKPRVSIGLPVYNGQRFIRATIDSILAQTFTDFELIICDNCSNDATERICRDYAAGDPRIRYFRNERNLGPAPNYNRCFELARAELFKWSAADDTIAPDFLEKCIAELDRDASLVGCYTRTTEIDADGQILYEHKVLLDLENPVPARRLASLAFVSHRHHAAPELWGVFRSEVLRRWKPLKGSYPCADRLVIARILLQGPVRRVEENLFFNRDHGNRSVKALVCERVRPGSRLVRYVGCGPTPSYEWWDQTRKGRIVFPEFRWLGEYYRAVWQTSMPRVERLQCYGVMLGLTLAFLPRLSRDLVIASEQLFNRVTGLGPSPATSQANSNFTATPSPRA